MGPQVIPNPPPGFEMKQSQVPPLPPGFEMRQASPPGSTGEQPTDPNEAAMQAKMQQGMTQGPQSLIPKSPSLTEGFINAMGTLSGVGPLTQGSGESALGLAEQIPAGLQAAIGLGEKIYGGVTGLFSSNSTAAIEAKKQQEEFAQSSASQALTPRTETGQNITAAIGSAIGLGQQKLQDPQFQEKYFGKEVAHGPVGAGIAAFAEMAPDLAIAYGIKAGVAERAKTPNIDSIKPGTDIPQSPTDTWKEEQQSKFPDSPTEELIGKQFGGRPAEGIEEQSLAGGRGEGPGFSFYKDILDHPELTHAVQFALDSEEIMHEQAKTASDEDLPHLLADHDNHVDRLATELRAYGITSKDAAEGLKIHDMISDRVWDQLNFKWAQQDSRAFTSKLAQDGTRTVDPGVEAPSKADRINGQYPDQAIPISALGKAVPVSDTGGLVRIRQTLDINATLDHIIANTENPVFKSIATKLRDFDLMGSKFGVTMNIATDPLGKVMLGADTEGRQAANYGIGTKQVTIGMRGLTERVFLHEMIHSVTLRAMLGAIKDPLASMQGKASWAVDESHPLAPHVKAIVSAWNQLSDIAAEHHPEAFADRHNGSWLYGLENPAELMAEVGTNQKFMSWLNHQVIMEGDKPLTILGKIRNAFKGILGKETTENALDHVMFHTSEVANAYAQAPKMWDEFFERSVKDEFHVASKTVAGSAINNIPGVGKIDWIPDPEPFEKAKPKILKEKDGGSNITGEEGRFSRGLKETRNTLGPKATPGSIMASALRESTLVDNISRIMTGATKRADAAAEHWTDPVNHALSKLKEDARSGVQSVFMKELQSKARYTLDQLKQLGLNDKQIGAYTALRTSFDESLKRQNEVRAEHKLKPIQALDAYHAARFQSGSFRADFVDANGKRIWGISEKTPYDRQKAINWIQKNHPDLRLANLKKVDIGQHFNSLQAGYLEMLDFLDKTDPRTQALKSTYEEMLGTKTENVAGQERHFQIKSGVRGYLGDRPWIQKNATQFFEEQLKYLEGAAKWTEMQRAFQESAKYTADKEIRTAQPNNVAYAEEYVKHTMGFGSSKLMAELERKVAGAFGQSPQTFMNGMSFGKKYFYILELSWKFPFMMISLAQHSFAMAQHAMLDSEGFSAKNPGYIFDGFKYGTQHALLDAKEFGLSANPDIPGMGIIEPMQGFWSAAREYAHANKIMDQNPLLEAQDIKSGPIQHTIEQIGNFPTATVEKLARGWTYYGLVSHLADSGKFDLKDPASLKEMFYRAEKGVSITMGDYRPTERPMIFNQMGMMGKMAAALKTYPTNYMGQLMLYTREASRGNYKPLAWFLAMQFAVGGAGGMVAVNDLDAIWNFLKRHMPSGMYEHVKDYGIKKWMSNPANMSDFVYHGPLSKLTGLNIDVQGSMGRLIPGLQEGLEAIGRHNIEYGALADAATQYFPSVHENLETAKAVYGTVVGTALKNTPAWVPKPTPNETAEHLYEATPTGAKGLIREKDSDFHKGDLMMNPHKLEEGQYIRNKSEHVKGEWGFKSPQEQRAIDASHAYRQMKTIMDEHRKEVIRDLEEYALRKDTAQIQRLAPLYYQLGGNINELDKTLTKAAIEKMTDMRERAAFDLLHETNMTKIKQAQEFLQSLTPQ